VGADGRLKFDNGSDYLLVRRRFSYVDDDLILPLLAGRGGEGQRDKKMVVADAWRLLLRVNFLCLPPPTRGRFGIGGGPSIFDGVREDSSVGLLWRWEVFYSSNTSAASLCRPTSSSPVKESGGSLTSFVRPLPRLVPVYYGNSAASGFVPASGLDGGATGLWLDGGDREGPDCYVSSFSEVFSAYARDLCVILNLMGSFVIICKSTALILT
jgi:hypothetical protein